jgi:hypothetical protein
LLDIKQAGWVRAGHFSRLVLSSPVMLMNRQKSWTTDWASVECMRFLKLYFLCTMFRNAQWYHSLLALLCLGFLHFLHALFPHRSCFPIFQVGSGTLKLTNYCLGEENQYKLY